MKTTRKLLAGLLCLALLICCLPGVYAAEALDAIIDYYAKCSLTIYKYDFTNAQKDGVWNNDSFISTGWRESYVEDTLGNAVRKNDADGETGSVLGNGETSNGYAIKGVEFSYLRVADLVTYSEVTNGKAQIRNLYGFNKEKSAALLAAIGLADGAGRFEPADTSDKLDHTNYYYTSDTLNKALYDALAANATTVKDALEYYMTIHAETKAMPLTDENGRTSVNDLAVGLYLLVETKVPEMVTSTTNPFFVSLPMTTVSGNAHSSSQEGGHGWNYDVVLYPKNETGIPSLEKTVREAKADGGKHNGTEAITDGYAHNATASAGDTLEYQIISGLPTITSDATSLTYLKWFDSLDAGLSYTKGDVRVRIYSDKACENLVADWDQDSGNYTVTYSADNQQMTIEITNQGIAEINGNPYYPNRPEALSDEGNVNGDLHRGYSNYTIRITYTATINSDSSFVYGDAGNHNEVVMTWQRTSTDYFDTLIDDAHVYAYGIDLLKLLSNKDAAAAKAEGLYDHVKFKLINDADGSWITATLNDADGTYYVTGHVTDEADATEFSPVDYKGESGHINIKGLEDDEYVLVEVETANGYVLSTDPRYVVITATDDATRPCNIYSKDVLGVLQNDPRFNFDGNLDLHLAGIPQQALAHNYLSASATVDGRAVEMTEGNALAPLEIINHEAPAIPATGESGLWLFSSVGLVGSVGAIFLLVLNHKKKDEKAENA